MTQGLGGLTQTVYVLTALGVQFGGLRYNRQYGRTQQLLNIGVVAYTVVHQTAHEHHQVTNHQTSQGTHAAELVEVRGARGAGGNCLQGLGYAGFAVAVVRSGYVGGAIHALGGGGYLGTIRVSGGLGGGLHGRRVKGGNRVSLIRHGLDAGISDVTSALRGGGGSGQSEQTRNGVSTTTKSALHVGGLEGLSHAVSHVLRTS